jgi:competence protein ComEA
MKRPALVVPFLVSSLLQLAQVPAAQAQDLPEGKGKDVVEQVCGSCHETYLILTHGRTTKQNWSLLVDDMASRGTAATEEQIQTIKDYLVRNLGQVNVNKAPSAEIASILEITPAQADAIVNYKTDHGTFKSINDLKKVPGIESVNLDAKKDRIVY